LTEEFNGKESNDRKDEEGAQIQGACSQQVRRMRQAPGFYQKVPDVQGMFQVLFPEGRDPRCFKIKLVRWQDGYG